MASGLIGRDFEGADAPVRTGIEHVNGHGAPAEATESGVRHGSEEMNQMYERDESARGNDVSTKKKRRMKEK